MKLNSRFSFNESIALIVSASLDCREKGINFFLTLQDYQNSKLLCHKVQQFYSCTLVALLSYLHKCSDIYCVLLNFWYMCSLLSLPTPQLILYFQLVISPICSIDSGVYTHQQPVIYKYLNIYTTSLVFKALHIYYLAVIPINLFL